MALPRPPRWRGPGRRARWSVAKRKTAHATAALALSP